MRKKKKKKTLPGAPAALKLGQRATVTVAGPTDTLMLLLSILMPEAGGINYHLTHDLPLLPLRRAIFALITDDRKPWTQLKHNLCSSCLLFLLKDMANYVRRRAATTTDSE